METSWVNKTYELIDEIKSLKQYKRLQELHQYIEQNPQLQQLISGFNQAKLQYDEVSKYGKYHPDLKEVQLRLKDVKENLYTNDIIKEYKELEQYIQKQLNGISKALAQSVSKKIKHPNSLGLINKQ